MSSTWFNSPTGTEKFATGFLRIPNIAFYLFLFAALGQNLLIAVGVDANISVWKIDGEEGTSLAASISASAPSSGHYAVTSTAVCGRELQITLKFAIHCGASPHSRCYIEHF